MDLLKTLHLDNLMGNKSVATCIMLPYFALYVFDNKMEILEWGMCWA